MIMDISTTFLPAANNINPRLVPHKRLFSYSSMINPSYHHTIRSKNRLIMIKAKKGGDDQESDQYERKSIAGDEKYSMMVLKMRIKKMKVLESNNMNNDGGAADPSSDWKEWEKKLFTNYHEGVCDSIELLQSYLMNTRPSVALGAMMLAAMSVPFSTSVVMVNALKVAKGLLAGCHVCIDIDF